MRVVYLQTAVEDLASIYKYISRDSVKYAKLEVKRIKAFAESIKSQPLAGKIYQTMHGSEVRSIVYRNYIIYYIPEESRISIFDHSSSRPPHF